MNQKIPPFDNIKVRRAIAFAIPYQKILDVALYNKARPLFGGSEEIKAAKWPQRSPYSTDLAKAKSLLVEAGLPNGFETTFSFRRRQREPPPPPLYRRSGSGWWLDGGNTRNLVGAGCSFFA